MEMSVADHAHTSSTLSNSRLYTWIGLRQPG